MRPGANDCGTRSNALWGRGSRGELRSNALWGRGGRRAGAVVALLAVACTLAATATAGGGNGSLTGPFANLKAYVPDSLLSAIQQNPKQSFDVILEGAKNERSNALYARFVNQPGPTGIAANQVKRQFLSIDGMRLSLTGNQILFLAKTPFVSAILANEAIEKTSVQLPLYSTQLWPWAAGAAVDWVTSSPTAPTIAIVDSGIDPAHTADFGSRVLGQVDLSSLDPNATGDDYGHGTFVAGVAAGAAPGYAGAAPKANLLSVKVMNNQGESTVADVIAACDWILQNKSTYNIKVANFSLHAVNRASVLFDPLDQAVEKLWLNGVTVVAAAGNYAVNGVESGVQFAPGNDPFVITVGAADIGTSLGVGDDSVAPWSAWGYTPDGFMKPDLGAPGRYMIGPVSAGGGLAASRPDKVVAPGYMQLSGTSFAAPVVSAAAAMLAAQHPTWTPDQIKGALLLSAKVVPNAQSGQLGVGEVNIFSARLLKLTTPPNPNAGLDQYLTTASDGTTVFDSAAWQSAALANAAWGSAAWSDAAWSSAAWSSAAWASAAWASAAWASAAWGSAAWSDAAWSDAAWSDAAWADGSSADPTLDPSLVTASDADQSANETDLGIVDPNCDPTITVCQAATTTP
jgi:serine protease AprX